ncbi:MAG: flavin reductase family protein [Candidatus Gastranaerophilales bacterium]|nr:flavin reductase family protein [Candidatus Gastranaerophilales bacterium]
MQKIEVKEYLPQIMNELPKGILLSTKNGNKYNTMTIGWGQVGIEWGKMFFTVYVRHGRFTHKQIEASKEFTVNVPTDRKSVAKAIAYCGSRSGENLDKFSDCGLTVVDGISVNSPAIKEIPLTIECKVIYQQEQCLENIPPEILASCYPQDIPSDNPRANRDFHTVYYGEIVHAYIL